MKKAIKIGIPKALLYYRYGALWKEFFENLDCEVIISPDTNKEIISYGKKYSIDESCLSSKIYMGHVYYLLDKCDYILVPRICDYGKNNNVCVKFNGIVDVVKNTFKNVKILNYNIERTKCHIELIEFIKMGIKLKRNIFKVIKSYIKAKKVEKLKNELAFKEQEKKLESKKIKILLVSHPYNIYDKYVGEPITNYLNKMNIELIYADLLNKNLASSRSLKLSKTLYWKYSKELVGAVDYYQEKVDGIIFITSFPCGPDSLVNELLIRKLTNIPVINVIIDESTAEAGLITRLESFIDILKERNDNNG